MIKNIPKIELNIPSYWKTHWNHFLSIDPDNNLPIDDVWFYFSLEDIAYFTFKEYFIDIGFYGDYSDNRSGTFRLIISKGSFLDPSLFEFETRSSLAIKEQIEKYLAIPVSDWEKVKDKN